MTDYCHSDVAIYVASFDGYSDLWQPFFESFFKFWPDCPFKIYLGTNQKKFPDRRVISLPAGDHTNWSSRVFEHLSQIPEPYVLLMIEDCFLSKAINTATLEELASYIKKFDFDAIRLFAEPKPMHAISGYPLIGLQGISQQNRTSTHATFWRKSSLLQVMREGESLWEYEINGSVRSNRFPGGICGTWETVLPYVMGVDKGKWMPMAYKMLQKNGIAVDLNARPLHARGFEINRQCRKYFGGFVRALLPLHVRQCIIKILHPDHYTKRVK